MGRRARFLAAAVVFGALVPPVRADDEPASAIGIGESVRIRLGGPGGVEERSFRLELATDVPGLVVTCTGASGNDFDVYVRRGETAAAGEEEAEWFGVTSGPTETVHVGGEAGLPHGTYRISVRAVSAPAAAEATLAVRALEGPSGCASCGGVPPPVLAPGTWTSGRILAKVAPIDWYSIEIPPKAATLDVQVVDAASDVDLVLASPKDGAVLVRSMTERVDEGLHADVARLAPGGGRIWMGVVDRTFGEDDVAYRVAFAFDTVPALPADLRLPPYPREAGWGGIEAAADAIVEVSTKHGGGSGACVSPGGLVLTCRHVLEGDKPTDPLQDRGILIAFTDDLRRPARQTHRAVLLEADEPLDLALLQIDADVYGRPIPPEPGFPSLSLRREGRPVLGEAVTGLGFPEAGSEHARTGIIVTRGVVAGLESGPGAGSPLDWIKTDARIGPGHSGGALIDGDLRLLGVVAATLGEERSLGLVRPVSRLPIAWIARIGAARNKTGSKSR